MLTQGGPRMSKTVSMRTVSITLILGLAAIVALTPREPSAPMPSPGRLPEKSMSFRIIFGERQVRQEDYSGSLTLTQGHVLHVTPWRLFGDDSTNPNGSWKVHIKRISFENQPEDPRPMDTAEGVLNYVPAGVTVTVEAPPTATAQVSTPQGILQFALRDVRDGHPLSFVDGDVLVQRTPTPQQISPVPEGPTPEEHDYPSIYVTRKGVVWIAWQAYQDRGDHVYAKYSTATGWSQPMRLTEEKGDIFHTAVAEDSDGRIWVVWSERKGENWDLYARTFDGKKWAARRKLTDANHPNIFHKLVADHGGTLHLVWIGYQNGQSHVLLSTLHGDHWSKPVEVSGPSAWMPDAACDSAGNLYIAWDSYRTGNYDIFCRTVHTDGVMEAIQQITQSGKFHAHASLAVDRADRVWLAWDESGDNWGKDWNRDDQSRSTTLYSSRHPRVAVMDNGIWNQPAGDIAAAVSRRYNQFVEEPRLACDSQGRIWVELQIRTSVGENRIDHWASNGQWESFLTSYEGDHWARLTPIPDTSSRPDGTFQITAGTQGIWMAWINNNKRFGPVAGFQPPMSGAAAGKGPHRPGVQEIDAATFAHDEALPPAKLTGYRGFP